jgi:hypothetical protein
MTPTLVIGKILAFEMSRKMGQEEATSSTTYAFACDEKKKGKNNAPSSSSSSEKEEEYEEEDDDDEDDQALTSSFKDEETVWRVRKAMRMICKINLKGVPLQVEDLLFNIDRKKRRKRWYFACGEKVHFWDSCPNTTEPKKRRAKARRVQSIKTWNDSSSEDETPRTRSHRSSSSSSRSSHKCLIARGNTCISSSSDSDSDDEDKPSIDELVHAVKFFEDICTKQKAQLKVLKSK